MLHLPLRRSGWLWLMLLELHWFCPDPSGRPYVGRSLGDAGQYVPLSRRGHDAHVLLHLATSRCGQQVIDRSGLAWNLNFRRNVRSTRR